MSHRRLRNVYINGFLHTIPACKLPIVSSSLNLHTTKFIFQRYYAPVKTFLLFPAFYVIYFPIWVHSGGRVEMLEMMS